MAMMMTEMDLLMKDVMGSGYKAWNAVAIISGVNPNEAHFEDMYNEIVHFLENLVGGSRLSYPMPGEIELASRISLNFMMCSEHASLNVGLCVGEAQVTQSRPNNSNLPND
ncbi:hypothetical protein MTR67_039224 [Solanum verrucosum]|uniref:Uncharacterized protein n=1 Tax=Solanum verrucosum TaxID=315347 RepID=A0AAF0UIE1_SOLVR|nr:hypothetical protein MTR67_039224 [Solanum verrucosum]